MDYKYRVSVIVPVFNAQKYLCTCLDSLVGQTIEQKDMQVILIDDGSTDGSAEICRGYCEKHSNFVYKRIENSGVSAARNCGLKISEGKYIMYLDSDDTLSDVSVLSVADFFDGVYDEVDLVAYFIQPHKNGTLLKPPARYSKILTHSGVFDLEENPYITQTTMNICVKNMFSDNILFNEKMSCQEDQEYINRVLMSKLRIGYCSRACYMYNRDNENSCFSTKFHSYYLFEGTMKYFEELFAQFEDRVPRYFQAVFFHDLRWKLTDKRLYPFHYKKAKFEKAVNRIKKLLARVDTDIIVNNPSIRKSHVHYWLNMKPNVYPTVYVDKDSVDVLADGRTIEQNSRVSMRLIRISVLDNGWFRIRCECGMGVFNYMDKAPLIYAVENGQDKKKMVLYRSGFSYVGTDIKTNKVYGFEYSFDPQQVKSLSFRAVIDSYSFDVRIGFMWSAVFRHKIRFYAFAKGGYVISYYNDTLLFEKKTKDEIRALELKNAKALNQDTHSYELKCAAIERREKSRIWLYCDFSSVVKSNAYYQFQNDFGHDDNTERYYIYTRPYSEIENLFTDEQKNRLVEFGSYEHRVLYLSAQIIFTSFPEREKYSPFFLESEEMKYIDIEHFRTVYLQNEIMKFSCPDRFSAEKNVCDKVVVSSPFEVQNLTGKYRFKEDELIKTGMPKLSFLDRNVKAGERVLFAPLWRSYFSPEGSTDKVIISVFDSSDYCKGIKAFLNDDRLYEVLEKSGIVLDFLLVEGASAFFDDLPEEKKKHINLIEGDVRAEDYKLLITDFSDLAFDFAFLSRPVLYFVPDYPQFKSGMGLYRSLDLPFDKAFGPFSSKARVAVEEFIKLAQNGFVAEPQYMDRMKEFYFQQMSFAEGIYNYVSEKMSY